MQGVHPASVPAGKDLSFTLSLADVCSQPVRKRYKVVLQQAGAEGQWQAPTSGISLGRAGHEAPVRRKEVLAEGLRSEPYGVFQLILCGDGALAHSSR